MGSVVELNLTIGEIYVFSNSCISDSFAPSLRGVYAGINDGCIVLEAMTYDDTVFQRWCPLPSQYSYVRLSSREEVRDFYYGLGYYEYSDIKRY